MQLPAGRLTGALLGGLDQTARDLRGGLLFAEAGTDGAIATPANRSLLESLADQAAVLAIDADAVAANPDLSIHVGGGDQPLTFNANMLRTADRLIAALISQQSTVLTSCGPAALLQLAQLLRTANDTSPPAPYASQQLNCLEQGGEQGLEQFGTLLQDGL